MICEKTLMRQNRVVLMIVFLIFSCYIIFGGLVNIRNGAGSGVKGIVKSGFLASGLFLRHLQWVMATGGQFFPRLGSKLFSGRIQIQEEAREKKKRHFAINAEMRSLNRFFGSWKVFKAYEVEGPSMLDMDITEDFLRIIRENSLSDNSWREELYMTFLNKMEILTEMRTIISELQLGKGLGDQIYHYQSEDYLDRLLKASLDIKFVEGKCKGVDVKRLWEFGRIFCGTGRIKASECGDSDYFEFLVFVYFKCIYSPEMEKYELLDSENIGDRVKRHEEISFENKRNQDIILGIFSHSFFWTLLHEVCQ